MPSMTLLTAQKNYVKYKILSMRTKSMFAFILL